MKTTIELPDLVLREAKAAAASRGESLKDFFLSAVRSHLAPPKVRAGEEPWRKFVGVVDKAVTDEVDAVIDEEFGRIDYETWR